MVSRPLPSRHRTRVVGVFLAAVSIGCSGTIEGGGHHSDDAPPSSGGASSSGGGGTGGAHAASGGAASGGEGARDPAECGDGLTSRRLRRLSVREYAGVVSDLLGADFGDDVGKYYTELVTDLGQRLAAIPQAGGATALDNSLVVWGNEIATGPHGTDNLPIVLLGGAAGRLKRTGYVVDADSQPHHRLGCSLHHIMGDPVDGFGAMPDCGVLQELELA